MTATIMLLSVAPDDDMPERPEGGWQAATYPVVARSATLRFMATEPVGVLEVAAMLGVKDRTVHQWINRGLMPKAKWASINGSRAWERQVILEWAGQTGRIRESDLLTEEGAEALREEYRKVFKADPVAPRMGGRRQEPPPPKRRRRAAG